jgi:hypothetical protein
MGGRNEINFHIFVCMLRAHGRERELGARGWVEIKLHQVSTRIAADDNNKFYCVNFANSSRETVTLHLSGFGASEGREKYVSHLSSPPRLAGCSYNLLNF